MPVYDLQAVDPSSRRRQKRNREVAYLAKREGSQIVRWEKRLCESVNGGSAAGNAPTTRTPNSGTPLPICWGQGFLHLRNHWNFPIDIF